MPARITIILNASAAAHDASLPETLAIAFDAFGCAPAIFVTPGPGVTTLAAEAVQAGSQIVVAAGGDGTVGSVATALVGTRAALGVLPMGTLNHFARDVGIPLALEDAVRTIAFGHATSVDVGDVNGRVFVNNSSVGIYPRLVLERERLRKHAGLARWMALVLAAWSVWWGYQRLRVLVRNGGDDPREVRTPFVFVGNNEYQLDGVEFGARPRLNAARLQLCLAPDMTRAGLAVLVLSALLGHLTAVERFEATPTSDVTVQTRRGRVPVALDGEVLRFDLPLAYRSRPGALRVIVPAESTAGGATS